MGNVSATPCTLSKEEIGALTAKTNFTSNEIRAIWHHFKAISGGTENIDRSQFQVAMLFKDSALLDRMFRVFDNNDDNVITFEEYVACLSVISTKASKEDKMKLSFQIYDFDCDNLISVADLTAVVAATLREHGVVISRAELDAIVANTMKEAKPAKEGMIAYDEYKKLITQRPQMLAHLTLNISSIIVEYTNATAVTFATPRRP